MTEYIVRLGILVLVLLAISLILRKLKGRGGGYTELNKEGVQIVCRNKINFQSEIIVIERGGAEYMLLNSHGHMSQLFKERPNLKGH